MLWPNGTKTKPKISSPFGPRKSPTAGASSSHKGTDFTGYKRVRAIAAGTVTKVGTPSGWSAGGTQVWIQHDGFLTRSLHLVKGSPVVKVGQKVNEGDDLGEMGKTGTATGVHHHLEVVVNGVQIDPVPFITARIGTDKVTVNRDVKSIQRLVGAAQDGIYGPDTTAKVKAWQGANGLAADGIWGPASDAKGFPPAPAPAPASGRPTVRRGGKGEHVRALQQKLKANYELYAGRLVVDGDFGPATEAAVREFQRRAGLTVDGIVGPQTWARIGL